MPTDEGRPAFGGWSPGEMRPTLEEFSGIGSDFDLDDASRFLRGVARVVRKRDAVDRNRRDPKVLSVFLLSPNAGGLPGVMRDPMLDAGQTAIAGKIWFVNPAVASGKARLLEATDNEGAFRTVTDDLGFGNVPAAVVDPRGARTEVRYYPHGLNRPDDRRLLRLDCSDLDLQQISEIVEAVYRQCLITPDANVQGGNPLWKDAAKFRPHENAEHRVQAYLKPAFAAALPTCRIYHEFAGSMGRADLHIQEHEPLNQGSVALLAVLELKVLRSYSASGKTTYSGSQVANWIEDGVKQAGAYRREHGHRVAMLCCFDMRKDDTGEECFSDKRDLADEHEVALRRWYLYASSELARNAVTTTPPA